MTPLDDEHNSSISPTAHYTGAVWGRHGLSHPALATTTGRLMFHGLRPTNALSKALGGATLEEMLVARHLLIDNLLAGAIDAGEVSQVIEIAAGLSARGWRFARRYGDRITYLETDLPAMAARKAAALELAASLGPRHRVVTLDALSDEGADSLGAVAGSLEPARGLAIITEGLLSYLDRDSVDRLWRQIASTLSGFTRGLYLSDLHLESENAGLVAAGFMRMLSAFVRGQVAIHFADDAETLTALAAAGFVDASIHRGDEAGGGRGAELVHVTEARTATS